MSQIRIVGPVWDGLEPELMADPRETCAAFFTDAGVAGRLLARTAEIAPRNAYSSRTPTKAELQPAYLVDLTVRARRAGAGLVLVHTHPFDSATPNFSAIDDAGEEPLRAFLEARLPGRTHAAMVVSHGGVQARELGAGPAIEVIAVGADMRRLSPRSSACASVSTVFDRQVRAFGAAGQEALAALEVGVVGVGGTGSVVAQELALLGVRRFVLVDPDRLEATNRNRVFGAAPALEGCLKTRVAAANIERVNPAAEVEAIDADVLTAAAADRLAQTDFIFLCTDSHASRAMVAQLAYQHLVPTVDMGVSIGVGSTGTVEEVTGRIQMLSPGLACLVCSGALSAEAIRRELMTPEQRAADPYFRGAGEPQPAVASLNATAASLAVSMFMAAVTGAPLRARYQWYDGVSGRVRTPVVERRADCLVCSASGAMARGLAVDNPLRGVR